MAAKKRYGVDLDPGLVARVDRARGEAPRQVWIARALEAALLGGVTPVRGAAGPEIQPARSASPQGSETVEARTARMLAKRNAARRAHGDFRS